MIFGAIPPPRNFAKIRTRGGRGLQPEQPKDLIPPWRHSRTQRRGAAAVPEPGGRGEKTAVCLGEPDAGGFRRGGASKAQCRAARRALPSAGSWSLPSGRRREAGRGRACPREAHKGRVAGATARCGHVAGRRGTGGIRQLSGVDAGKARAGAAVSGGRDGYNRWRRASYRDAAGGGAGQAKNALSCAACVGLQATGGKAAAARAKKPVFAI